MANSKRLTNDERFIIAKLAKLPGHRGLIVDECSDEAETLEALAGLGLAEMKRGQWDKIMGRITPRGRRSFEKACAAGVAS